MSSVRSKRAGLVISVDGAADDGGYGDPASDAAAAKPGIRVSLPVGADALAGGIDAAALRSAAATRSGRGLVVPPVSRRGDAPPGGSEQRRASSREKQAAAAEAAAEAQHLADSALVRSVAQAKRRAREAFDATNYGEAVKWFSEALTLLDTATAAAEAAESETRGALAAFAYGGRSVLGGSVTTEQRRVEQVALLLNRSAAHARLGDHRNAAEDAHATLSIDPANPRAFLKKGKALLKLQQHAAASETFAAGLAQHPANSDLKDGFNEAIRGLRLGRHRFAPAYAHSGSGAFSIPLAERTHGLVCPPAAVGGPRATSPQRGSRVTFVDSPPMVTMSGLPSAAKIDVSGALADREVNETIHGVGALLNIEDVFAAEADMAEAIGVPAMTQYEERASVLAVVLEYHEVLLHLFCRYCEMNPRGAYGASTDLSGGAAAAPRGRTAQADRRGGAGVAPARFKPISARRSMSEQQFWQFCVDSGLVTRTFNRRAVQTVWTNTMRGIHNAQRMPPPLTKSSFDLVADSRGSSRDGSATARARMESTPGSPGLAAMPQSTVRMRGIAANTGGMPASTTSAALFPKFVEALIRLSTARYRPAAAARIRPGGEAEQGNGAAGAAGRRDSFRGGAPALESSRSRASLMTPGFGSTPRRRDGAVNVAKPSRHKLLDTDPFASTTDDVASLPVPRLSQRLKYAFDAHVLSHPYATSAGLQALGAAPDEDAEDPVEWAKAAAITRRYQQRLAKIFRHFAALDEGRREMDIREFVYMLKALGIVDHRALTLREATRTTVAVTGFIGDLERQRMQYTDFCEALVRCCDVKTHDGIMPIHERLDTFLVADFFQRVKAKTDIAALWR